MSVQLYAIAESRVAAAMTADPDLAQGFGVDAVHALGLAVLFGPPPKKSLFQNGKVRELRQLVAFEQVLETLLRHGHVLPIAPGSVMDDEEDALAFLAANVSQLRNALNSYGGKVQFQVTIEWDPIKALERAKNRDDFGDIRRLAERDDRKALGRAVQRAMETERAALAERYAGMITAAAEDVIRLPVANAAGVVNLVAMIEHADEIRLDRAVEAVDASWPDALTIKYAGPLPALSFAGVRVERPDPGAIVAASARLGVTTDADPDDLRDAYRTAMKRAHPDRAIARGEATQGANLEAGALAEDYKLLLRVSEARQMLHAFSRDEAVRLYPPLAELHREGDAAHAA